MRPAFSLLLFAILLYSNCQADLEQKDDRMQLIIDADTANEVDDLFALVRAIADTSIHLIGITAAQFHTSPLASVASAVESQEINENLLRLMGRKEVKAILGSNSPLGAIDQPARSPASRFIIETAHALSADQQLDLVILGSCTNVASAILQDPTIIPKVRVHYLGFWHDPATNVYDKKEFNSRNDSLAVNFLLNTVDLEFDVMTATTSQQLVFEKAQVEQALKGKGALADYLLQRWETYDRWWTEEDPNKEKWVMWDVAIIEALMKPELAERSLFQTPKENTARSIGVYTSLDAVAMKKDFWNSLSAYPLK